MEPENKRYKKKLQTKKSHENKKKINKKKNKKNSLGFLKLTLKNKKICKTEMIFCKMEISSS